MARLAHPNRKVVAGRCRGTPLTRRQTRRSRRAIARTGTEATESATQSPLRPCTLLAALQRALRDALAPASSPSPTLATALSTRWTPISTGNSRPIGSRRGTRTRSRRSARLATPRGEQVAVTLPNPCSPPAGHHHEPPFTVPQQNQIIPVVVSSFNTLRQTFATSGGSVQAMTIGAEV